MLTISRILTLCYLFCLFGWVTSDSDCGSDPFQSEIKLLVNMGPLENFLETTKQSGDSASTEYFYSKEPISCSKNEDCSKQGCCGDKVAACNGNTKNCDCLDSSNKFTGRPLLYIKNDGKCGVNQAGCTICLELDKSGGKLSLGQGQGDRKALAPSSNGNQTSMMEKGDFAHDVRIGELVLLVGTLGGVVGSGISAVQGIVTSIAGEILSSLVTEVVGVLGIGK